MTEINEKVIQFLIETWKKSYLDDNLLFLKTGMKKKTGVLRKFLNYQQNIWLIITALRIHIPSTHYGKPRR